MKKVIFTLIMMLAYTAVSAQYNDNLRTLGDKAFRNKDYYEAAFYYKKVAEGMRLLTKETEIPFQNISNKKIEEVKGADRVYVSYQLADSYRLYENYLEAEGWYYKVINDNAEAQYPLSRLWYGVCLRADQHFDESISQLSQFAKAYKGDAKYIAMADKEIANCRFAKEQYQYPLLVGFTKLKDGWNGDGSNYAILKRDDNFWFTSSRMIKDDKKHLNRIYHTTSAKDAKPEIINLKLNDGNKEVEYGTPAVDPTGKRMYLTRWYKEGARTIHAIYKAEQTDGVWGTPQRLNSNINVDGFNAIQPFITSDGKQLYFVSNKPGGQGGDDIWVSDLDVSGNPINSTNLGDMINTPQDEQAPYYDDVNQRLIYSSKGFIGLGGFDFFESMGSIGNWQTPRNMGYPMNSAKDDLYYYPNGNDGKFYISSDRESECCLELFEGMDQRFVLKGLVVDCDTHKALPGVKVSFVDSLSKQTLNSYIVGRSATYTFNVTTKRPYNLVLEKKGYFSKVVPVNMSNGKLMKDTLYNNEICLQAFEVNKPIQIKNILYDYNRATLREESKTVLDGLVKILKDNPKIKIELASHTDSIGSDAYNQNLSQLRAQSCVDYIIASGVSNERIFAKGYGKSRPIAPNSLPNGQDNPDGRQLNRRTEFTVLKVE